MKLANITTVYRSKLIAKVYRKWLKKGCKVLDIGCGTGVIANELQNLLEIKVIGCDIEYYSITNLRFKKMKSPTKLPFKRKQFDNVMLNDVLHHTEFEIQNKLLNEAFRVANSVLIFELIPTMVGKYSDDFINKLHNPNMATPHTYRHPNEWKKMFDRLGYKCKISYVKKPLIYPFTHIAFLLYKN